MVFRRIDRLIGLRVLTALAIAVGVENERRPALGLLFVAGLVEQLCVQPPDDWPAATRPQGAIRILGEHQVVRAEAGADVSELLRLGIVHRQMSTGAIERKEPRRRMRRSRFAEGWIVGRT